MVAPFPSQARVPWYIWLCLLAVTSSIVGINWDISWHRSIGRDTFWTPAHVAIYLCGVLAGVVCGFLILSTTFDKSSPLRESSVTMCGFPVPFAPSSPPLSHLPTLLSPPLHH